MTADIDREYEEWFKAIDKNREPTNSERRTGRHAFKAGYEAARSASALEIAILTQRSLELAERNSVLWARAEADKTAKEAAERALATLRDETLEEAAKVCQEFYDQLDTSDIATAATMGAPLECASRIRALRSSRGVEQARESGRRSSYDVMADAVCEIADVARAAFIKAGFDPGEWDGDNIVQDVKRGLIEAIEQLAARNEDVERMKWLRENIDWLLDDSDGLGGCAFACQLDLAFIEKATSQELLDAIVDYHLAALKKGTPTEQEQNHRPLTQDVLDEMTKMNAERKKGTP